MNPTYNSERSRPALKPRFHRLRQARRKSEAQFDSAMDSMQCDLETIVVQSRSLNGGRYPDPHSHRGHPGQGVR